MSQIQSIVFSIRHGWIPMSARRWIKEHEFYPIKSVDRRIKGQLRYRLREPRKFHRFITKSLKGGINLVIGVN